MSDDYNDIVVAAAPLSALPRPLRDPPWAPMLEPNDPNLRHMAAGVAVALQLLMNNHAGPGPIASVYDEGRCAPR